MWQHDGPASEMHVGDLAWGTIKRWPAPSDGLRLWFDPDGRVQALTLFDGAGVCDLVVRPGELGLHAARAALDWAEDKRRSVATGPGPLDLRIGRRLRAPALVEVLEAHGFTRLATGVPAMSRSLRATGHDQPPPPAGYEIRAVRTEDLASRVSAFDAAFPGESLHIDAYRALRKCAPYVPALDIVAISPTGVVAAFATLWLDTHNAVVQIEPTGCRPEYRRQGLTRALLLHALAKAAELGATQALVRHVGTNDAAKSLYLACGFATVSERTGFAKTLGR